VAGGGTYAGTKEHCIDVDWPAAYTWSARQYRRGYSGPDSWMGSLIFESRDASGLYYRRNRYYDSEKGRFTQEDPIGLAGGVNVYGFAAGDPLSYGDSYGLCKVELQFTPAGVLGQHTTIITTSPNGSQRFYSGGPERDRGQLIGGSTGSAGVSAQAASGAQSPSLNHVSPGAGPSNGEPSGSFYGDVRVRSGVFRQGIPEYHPKAPHSTVLDDKNSCDALNRAFDAAARRINDANVAYNPFTQNSNSAAHYLLRSAGLDAHPGIRVVAWDTDLFRGPEFIMPLKLGIGLGIH
jgi:RHS repeat-associated protein